ncbi:MAG: WecB/TagA/CpsF family glycosyltransferase [Moheibacter sp.]
MENKIEILKTYYHNVSMKETLSIIDNAIRNRRQIQQVVINAAKIVALQKDKELRVSVNSSDLINIDGQAVVWAARFLNKPAKERVSGIDLMINLVDLAAQKGYKIFLLGAKEEVVSKLNNIYKEKYGPGVVAGYRNGYFKSTEEGEIIQQIVKSKSDMLFVAISSPKKENLLYKYKNELSAVPFIMGVGGSFDVLTGLTKRAPKLMQKLGMEWFFRLIQEPKRMWKRYLIGNSKFIALVLKEKFKSK